MNRDDDLVGFTATTRRLNAGEVAKAHREAIRARVEQVIAGRFFHTVWQPIYSLVSGGVVGVEALTRFSDPVVTQSPDRWFAEAHEVDLGQQLEILAIDAALASAATIPESIYLSLNVSPATLASGAVTAAIDRAGAIPARIVLELTEHVSIEDYGALIAALDTLRRVGVRLAVDDAGAGFASFRHILRLRPDIIKLDQSITRGIDANAAQRALGAALVMFAVDVGSIEVIAEGVETDGELLMISTLGIDAVQGYYLAKPACPDDLDFESVTPTSLGCGWL
jgi:EAL domain-containing protein (putative c-di-GMP-specific phosphodiesterase class I)